MRAGDLLVHRSQYTHREKGTRPLFTLAVIDACHSFKS